MQRRSQRLAVVQRLAETRERECAEALAYCNRELAQAEQQLASLRGYEEEYGSQKTDLAAGPGGARAMQNFVGFMSNLDQAITTQEAQVEEKRQQRDLVQQEWQRRYEKKKNLGKLIGRYAQEEERAIELQLQKEIDELVSLTNSTKNR